MIPPALMTSFVKLLVSAPERSRRFYEALGFTCVHADQVFTHLRWAEHADLFLVATPAAVSFPSARGAGVLLCFSAGATAERPSLEALLESATEQGATVDGPREQPWFTRELVVVDPDGYRLNFVEPLPTGAHSQ